ncbi:MAG: transglutaminase domain-containing protein [Candidatus Thermoplasmatota archaeon]|nr:transglutaminase domain-containing protein [Candidatus Thermoplasmatota archaeon]
MTKKVAAKRSMVISVIFLLVISMIPTVLSQSLPEGKTEDCLLRSRERAPLRFRWNAREITIQFTEHITNNGNITKNVTTYLAQPQTLYKQEIHGPIVYSPTPDGFKTDRWGQVAAHYNHILAPNESVTISWELNATLYAVQYILFPWRVRGEIPQEIIDQYTVDDEFYKINDPYIQNITKEVIGKEQNLLRKAKKLHNYVINHLEYVLDDVWDDAPTVLKRGNGSCSEYCSAYIALCRAADIPARYKGGTICKKEAPYEDRVYHRIAEIYLPSYGWVPIDVTYDDYTKLFKYANFGSDNNNLFIFSVGGGSSEYLDWNYHHWHEISPSPENIDITKSATWLRWEKTKTIRVPFFS